MQSQSDNQLPFIEKIVSGGQTGVDRGALDAARNCGIETGGWCPEGRRAEDGVIPAAYRMQELPGGGYEDRTKKNVLDSDATLILSRSELQGGTLLTRELAQQYERPVLVVNPVDRDSKTIAREWLRSVRPNKLNVAGPRESKDPGIQQLSRDWLSAVFQTD